MSNHSNKAIMDMISGSKELEKKWNELKTSMIEDAKKEFKAALGVDVPNAIAAQALEIQSVAYFSTDPSVGEYTKGVSEVLGAAFQAEWPQVALTAVTLVTTLVERILGKGEIQTGVRGESTKVTTHPDGQPTDERAWIVAIYTSTEQCQASDWGTNQSFYGTSFVFAVWAPRAAEAALLRI